MAEIVAIKPVPEGPVTTALDNGVLRIVLSNPPANALSLAVLAALYAGAICWVIGYDTIYALQDREDDALVGIRSSARAMGAHVQGGVGAFYAAAVALWALAFWLLRHDWVALLALVPVALHLFWQIATLREADGGNALARFRSNRFAGLLMALACWVVGNAGMN